MGSNGRTSWDDNCGALVYSQGLVLLQTARDELPARLFWFNICTVAIWPSLACLRTKRTPPVEEGVRHPSGLIRSIVIWSRFTPSYCSYRLEFYWMALSRGGVGWKWVQMWTDRSRVSCGQWWGFVELGQRRLFLGPNSYCQESLPTVIRDWGMAR